MRVGEERKAGVVIHRKVVNVSSVSATGGAAGQANYAAAKAGLVGLTRSLAKEWGPLAVNVNCVAFGYIETRLTQEISGETAVMIEGQARRVGLTRPIIEATIERIALGRAGTADEGAGGIMLFCLPEFRLCHGSDSGGQRRTRQLIATCKPDDPFARRASAMEMSTRSGIPLQRSYVAASGAAERPGEYPFTRGRLASPNTQTAWI